MTPCFKRLGPVRVIELDLLLVVPLIVAFVEIATFDDVNVVVVEAVVFTLVEFVA